MLPDPLHPAVVHLPLALAVVIPILTVLGTLLIHGGFLPPRTWAVVVLLQALLVGSAWLAMETGEDQEERVEEIVAERHIESHEEAAERFVWIAAAGLVVTALGLLPAGAGALGRVAGTLIALGVLAAGVYVGHSGGELVYKYGAAGAYVESPARSATPHRDED
jgi:uncharacterized membrane protein